MSSAGTRQVWAFRGRVWVSWTSSHKAPSVVAPRLHPFTSASHPPLPATAAPGLRVVPEARAIRGLRAVPQTRSMRRPQSTVAPHRLLQRKRLPTEANGTTQVETLQGRALSPATSPQDRSHRHPVSRRPPPLHLRLLRRPRAVPTRPIRNSGSSVRIYFSWRFASGEEAFQHRAAIGTNPSGSCSRIRCNPYRSLHIRDHAASES